MATRDQQLAQDMIDSDEALRAQFSNLNRDQYQGHDAVAVGVGGANVPASMMGAAPDGAYEAPPEIDYGPELDELMAARKQLTQFKKDLNRIPTIAASLKQKPDHQPFKDDLTAVLAGLEKYFELFPRGTEQGSVLEGIIAKYSNFDFDASSAALLKDESTGFVRSLARDLTKNLNDIKALKKRKQAEAKAAAE